VKILSVIGARPQFIKAAVFRKFCEQNNIQETLINTGQHYDPEMSSKIFDDLGVKSADYSLKVNGRSHASMTGEMMVNVETVLLEKKPDLVNVYGDTNTTVAAAMAAAKLNIPIMHVESGLRSFNKKMPEEINRIITDHVSDYLFCSTGHAVNNLFKENIKQNVHHVGDIMFDAIHVFKDLFKFPKLIKLNNKKLAVITVHRAENLSNRDNLINIIKYCERFLDEYQLIFPVHPNTRKHIENYNILTNDIILINPLDYVEMQGLLAEAELVLTDSGGLQKEAYFHNAKCITLRSETEWTETIECGWNKLWTSKGYKKIQEIKDYGRGDCCEKIWTVIEKSFSKN
jgi:UDP-GlcNAc3NAcA epimerase